MYGRFHYYGDRLRMQLGAGLVFIRVLLIGTLLSMLDAQITVRIMVIALMPTLITGIAIGYSWHPGGATFPVFAPGAVETMPSEWIDLAHVLIVGNSVLFHLRSLPSWDYC